jgi:L-lysine exporter family protein LysE/ArgO
VIDPASVSAGVEGFLLGASLIVAIGAQNAFVLRQGLERRHVFGVATVCALSDAVLIAAGVAGLGNFVQRAPVLLEIVTVAGAAFLFAYGALSLQRVFAWQETLRPASTSRAGLSAAVGTALALTWLSPHVYLDTVVLIGALSGRYAGKVAIAFGAGAVIASAVWFYGLGYGARLLAPLFARPRSWQVLDAGIAVVMWALAARLAPELWPASSGGDLGDQAIALLGGLQLPYSSDDFVDTEFAIACLERLLAFQGRPRLKRAKVDWAHMPFHCSLSCHVQFAASVPVAARERVRPRSRMRQNNVIPEVN